MTRIWVIEYRKNRGTKWYPRPIQYGLPMRKAEATARQLNLDSKTREYREEPSR